MRLDDHQPWKPKINNCEFSFLLQWKLSLLSNLPLGTFGPLGDDPPGALGLLGVLGSTILTILPPGPVSVPGVVPGPAGPTGTCFFPSGPGIVPGVLNAPEGTTYFTGFLSLSVTVPGVVPGPAVSTGTCFPSDPGIEGGVVAIEKIIYLLTQNIVFFR